MISIAFCAMLGMMLVGLPIATSMAAVGIVGGIAAYGLPFMDSIAPVVWGVQNENLLTSIPLFVLLGELLLRSGIADRMYVALSAWLGRMPGGLLHTNIGSCALFAATSGSSVATAATIGTVALPSLQRRGYPMRASLGTLAAGGTLGILIPPSVNMIVYGSLTNNSIGKLSSPASSPACCSRAASCCGSTCPTCWAATRSASPPCPCRSACARSPTWCRRWWCSAS
jgi:tripartite ATP-independent transporter DctM subunit